MPSVGQVVLYRLSPSDVEGINIKRVAGERSCNMPRPGDVLPMVVCAVHSPSCVNGQVLVDGDFAIWVTSRLEGIDVAQWVETRSEAPAQAITINVSGDSDVDLAAIIEQAVRQANRQR